MIRDDAVRHVFFPLVLRAEKSRIRRRARHLSDAFENRREDVRVVVAHLVLEDRGDALEAHAGVDVFRRERFEDAAFFAVKLDEDGVEFIGVSWR
jgi:hypothetical protein